METLLTASIGLLYISREAKFYMQIIFAGSENHEFIPITSTRAQKLSKQEDLEIETWENLPE